MTWTRQMNLYLNVDAVGSAGSPLLDVQADAVSPASTGPQFIRGDKFALNIYFRQFSSGAWTGVELGATDAIAFVGKLADELDDGDALFSAVSFSKVGSGTSAYYTATLDLNTSELATALATATSIEIVVDCEVQNADNSERATLQFDATVAEQGYVGTEGVPTEGDPAYPVPANIVTKLCGTESIADAASSVTVDLSSFALATAPSQALLTVEKPSASDLNIFAVVRSRSSTALVVDLSAAVDSANYKLHWLVVS